MRPTTIETLALDALLAALKTQPEAILARIDQDPLLKKREAPTGLIIANASPQLFEPEHTHQLFAKGIVYTRDPYQLVSLPLIKMYNHGTRELNDQVTAQIEALEDVQLCFAEKLDGTMIQAFAHQGQVYLTTRSILEGTIEDEDSPYTQAARQVLTQRYPQLLDAALLHNKSLIFELIHPVAKQVTHYGARQDMVLLSVFDLEHHHYWSNPRVFAWADDLGVSRPSLVIEDDALSQGIERLRHKLATDERIPEGAIVCFERQGRIVHRVKVKTQEYLERFSMRYRISLKTIADHLWDKPHLHDWDAYLEHLISEKLSEEEVEAFYRAFFDEFIAWYQSVLDLERRIDLARQQLDAKLGACPDDDAASRLYFKEAAAWAKANTDEEVFPMLMQSLRRGDLSLERLMWYRPAYPGFRELLPL